MSRSQLVLLPISAAFGFGSSPTLLGLNARGPQGKLGEGEEIVMYIWNGEQGVRSRDRPGQNQTDCTVQIQETEVYLRSQARVMHRSEA